MYKCSFLNIDIHNSWNDFLTKDILEMLITIEKQIDNSYTPNSDKVLRFLTTNLDKTVICIVGQDPYYKKGMATGRAFEVKGLNNWTDSFRQNSLKNIIRLMHKNYTDIGIYNDIKRFKDIQEEIKSGKFPILPPKEWFESLEYQGVLFLNSYFTCQINKPNSHRHIWKKFSQELIKYISEKKPNLKWFLWGNESKAMRQYISKGVFFESKHPMRNSNKDKDDFLKSNCFQYTKDVINWLG